MDWVHYALRFRLRSPLHVGHRRVGNLMQTKPYVPGKPLWAALTARLTRDTHTYPSRADYKCVGDTLAKNFRFGYLWPSLDGERPCFFWDYEGFEYTLLASYVSTALDYSRSAADEGTLHEVEYLSPYTRDEGRPVFLVGDLWVQDSLPEKLNGWKDALGRIQLGGERSYGWGRVRLLEIKDGRRGSGRTVTGFRWEIRDAEGEDEVVFQLPEGGRLPAHALAAGEGAVPMEAIQGPVEALSGWEHTLNDTPKTWELMSVRLAYAPGARLAEALNLIVGPWGWLGLGAEPRALTH